MSETDLVLAAQRGDEMAFHELVRRYDRRVLSIAVRYTGDLEEAKDLYQEVFLRVFRALPKFRSESQFSTWLHRIAVNVCLSHRRRSRRAGTLSWDALLQDAEGRLESAPEPVSPAPAADRCTFGREISGYVAAALARLSPQQRMVFALRHYEGYGLQQIAVMMSCSEGAVKRYLFDATDRLRRRLRPILARGAA